MLRSRLPWPEQSHRCVGRPISCQTCKDCLIGEVTYAKEDSFSRIGHDGNVVVGYHNQIVSVDGKELLSSSPSVDQPQSMRLSFLKHKLRERSRVRARPPIIDTGTVEIHFAVDEVVI